VQRNSPRHFDPCPGKSVERGDVHVKHPDWLARFAINSKSKTAIDCATVGSQLTNNKAHNVTRYDRMIMLGPLEPSARARVPSSFVAPRACAVVAFVRPRFGTAQVEWHLAIADPMRLGVAARGARPGQLPTIAGHRPSYDAKSPFRLSTETVDYAPVAPTTYGRAIRSGSTFSPPAICGCDGTKPLRASRCPTSARANANASFSRVVRRSATLKKASPK